MLEILGRIIAFIVIIGFLILMCLFLNKCSKEEKIECEKNGGIYIDGYSYYDSCIYE
jgi:hypothetical protein